MSLKALIVSSIFYGIFYVAGIALIDWLILDEIQSFGSYLFSGLFFGVFMGIGMPYVVKWMTKGKIRKDENSFGELQLLPAEEIEAHGPANLFRGIEGVGGKLFLTSQRIIFNSHKINIQTGRTDILYQEVESVQKRNTLGLMPNGIRVITTAGKKYNFVVNQREEWLFELNKRLDLIAG